MSAYVRPTNIILSEIKETISNSFELLRYNWSRSRSFFGSSGSATLGENKKKIHIEPWELVLFEALNFCNTYHIWLWVCWCIVLRLSFSWAHDSLFFSWAHDGLFFGSVQILRWPNTRNYSFVQIPGNSLNAASAQNWT